MTERSKFCYICYQPIAFCICEKINRYTPKMACNGKAEGVLEVKCGVIDCTLNDRSCIDNDYGFCNCDDLELDKKGFCSSYHQDFMFIAYISKTEYIGGIYSKYLQNKILPRQEIDIEPSTPVITEPMSVTTISKTEGVYTHNCTKCGRLHFWNKVTAIAMNFKYRCMECGKVNDMRKRPPTQTKFSFGEEGEPEIEIPEINPTFKVGDKIRLNPEFSNVKGIYVIDSILYEWGEPLYIISKTNGKETLSLFSYAKVMIKVE